MRVISGKYRSRRLQTLPGLELRPTADRLRETLFDILTAGDPSALEATVWVDLCAGTGAVGIEALSRGASLVYFVELAAKAAALIRNNLQSLEISEGFEILVQDAAKSVHTLERRKLQADFIFFDPPYRMEQAYRQTLEGLAGSKLLKPSGLVMVEHQKKFDPGAKFASLERYRLLQQGDAALSFYRTRL